MCFEYEYIPYELSRVLEDIQSQIMINNVLLHNWYSVLWVLNLYHYIFLSGLKLHNIMLNIRQYALRACWLCFLIVVSVVWPHGHDETKKKKTISHWVWSMFGAFVHVPSRPVEPDVAGFFILVKASPWVLLQKEWKIRKKWATRWTQTKALCRIWHATVSHMTANTNLGCEWQLWLSGDKSDSQKN